MSESLRVWLSAELGRRNLSHNELARQAGLAQSTVSTVLAGNKNPGCDFCIKVAQALDIAPETVLRLAGILPAVAPGSPTDDSILQELVELARNLPSKRRQEALQYIRFLTQATDDKD